MKQSVEVIPQAIYKIFTFEALSVTSPDKRASLERLGCRALSVILLNGVIPTFFRVEASGEQVFEWPDPSLRSFSVSFIYNSSLFFILCCFRPLGGNMMNEQR